MAEFTYVAFNKKTMLLITEKNGIIFLSVIADFLRALAKEMNNRS